MWKLSDWLSVAPFKCVSYFKVDELTGGQVNELLVDRGNKRQSNKWTCFKWTSRRVSQLHGDRGNKRQSNKWTCFKWTSRRVSQLLVDGVNKRQSNRWTCFKWRVFECTGQQVDKQLVNLLTHNSSTINLWVLRPLGLWAFQCAKRKSVLSVHLCHLWENAMIE